MKSYKTQFARISDAFIGVTAVIMAVTLVALVLIEQLGADERREF